MGAHWFDRLARARAASAQAEVGGSAELTRRDALARAGVATLGLSALGVLPVAASAAPRSARSARDAQSTACSACLKQADRVRNVSSRVFAGAYLKVALTPAVGYASLIYVAQVVGLEASRYVDLRNCAVGVCNPQAMSPAPSASPAIDVATGEPVCADGTHDCGVMPGSTAHYCCFGSDVCCNGTCCIADVGCACAAS